MLFFYPKVWDGNVVIWLHERGKDGLMDDQGMPLPEVAKLIENGVAVIGVDLFYQGEFLKNGQTITQTRKSCQQASVRRIHIWLQSFVVRSASA